MSGKKEYVQLWLSYETYFQSYTPEQVGNLVLAMLAYKDAGKEPEFYGPERFIWPAIRRDIDEAQAAQDAAAQQARENGKKGGRPRQAPEGLPFEDPLENPSGFLETRETTWTKDKDKDKDNSHRQGQEQGQSQTPAWAREKMSAANRLVKQLLMEAREEARAEEAEAGYDLPPTTAISPPWPDTEAADQSLRRSPDDS